MPRYKRTRDEAELDAVLPSEPAMTPESQGTLSKVRNMWEFASLMQYIFLFGHVVKIDDDLDIEDLETECLKPTPSDKLAHIGLQLLKYVSSHRGLTPDIFEEYTRRQYLAKAPKRNPFGDDEDPIEFNALDVYTRIKILQQLSTWTLGNAERIRGLMPQDEDHLNWRMEPIGWDKEDRAYYVLDDNRLYRRSDELVPPPTPEPKAKPARKAKSKSTKKVPRKGTRSSKRRKVEESEPEEDDETEAQAAAGADDDVLEDTTMANGEDVASIDVQDEPGYGFTSRTWECIAITLEQYQEFMSSIFRSRDPNEKHLRARIEEDVLPIIEKRAEALRQKQMKKLRELESLQKMATAKRSSRLADKADKEAKDREEREAEEQKQRELKLAREEQERQKRIEEGHESRRMTREQRVREREAKRILHEEELARLEEEGDRAGSQDVEPNEADTKRASGRQRQTQKEQHQKELEKLVEEDGNWYFDCSICGQHGENMDDGSHSIACDRCNVWQHSKCHGISPKQAEQDDFVFVCMTCKRKEEDAKKPKIPPIKLHSRSSASPEVSKNRPVTEQGHHANSSTLPTNIARQLDSNQTRSGPSASPSAFGQISNGPRLSPQGQAQNYRYPPVGNFAPRPLHTHQPPQQSSQNWQGSPPPAQGFVQAAPLRTGYENSSHYQHHHYAHQSAVANSGGHPGFQQPAYAMQHNGYGANHQPPTQYANQQWKQYSPPSQGPPPRELQNGFQSPAKAASKPVSLSSPPQHYVQPPQNAQSTSEHQPLSHGSPRLQQSPKTELPPPRHQHPQHSPVKSSPSSTTTHQPAVYQRPSPSQHPPQLGQAVQHFIPPGGSQHDSCQAYQLQTPQMRPAVEDGASSNATSVAADGMKGPWPESTRAIPQKHQSPVAPPASTLGEQRILPPVTPLAPSPGEQAAAVAGSIPVKRMQMSPVPSPDINGAPNPLQQAQLAPTRPSQLPAVLNAEEKVHQ